MTVLCILEWLWSFVRPPLLRHDWINILTLCTSHFITGLQCHVLEEPAHTKCLHQEVFATYTDELKPVSDLLLLLTTGTYCLKVTNRFSHINHDKDDRTKIMHSHWFGLDSSVAACLLTVQEVAGMIPCLAWAPTSLETGKDFSLKAGHLFL